MYRARVNSCWSLAAYKLTRVQAGFFVVIILTMQMSELPSSGCTV